MHRPEVTRDLTPDEYALVRSLLAVVEEAGGRRPLSDQQWLDLLAAGPGDRSGPGVHGGERERAGEHDGRFIAVLVRDAGHALQGYAQLAHHSEAWSLEVVTHPSLDEPRRDALTHTLIEAALAAVAGDGGGTVHWWVFEASDRDAALAVSAGLAPGRTLHQLRRTLPTGLPADLPTRSFRPGQDEAAWLAVNNRAFHDHPEQGGWTMETVLAREKEPWFDPDGFRLHERDGRLAGFCWTKVHADHEPVLGEIYVIAVDPDFHGLKLGKPLTLAGLDHLAGRGIGTAMLFVDAANPAAMAMYTALGFTVHRTDRAFVADVPAITRTVTA
jgi:mycothiol synthase